MRVYPELRAALIELTGKDQYPRFRMHAKNAKARGIPFNLTFPEWVRAFGDRLGERGRDGVVMCRNADQGGYEAGNIRIGSQRSNVEEYHRALNREKVREAWTFDGADRSANADWLDERRDMGYL